MIKKYNEFINESLEFILESDVIFSDNFKKILSKIDNPIAGKILSLDKKDIPVTQNFFDIDTERNNYLWFTPDRKAQEILNSDVVNVKFTGRGGGWLKDSDANDSIFNALGCPRGVYSPNSSEVGEVIAKHGPTAKGNTYVYVKFPGGEGVYNENKLRIIDDREKLVWNKNRQDVTVGRSMNALLNLAKREDDTINYTPRDLELFVNDYKAAIDKFNDKFSYFDVVKGDDIHYYYEYENYYEPNYTLDNSCMSSASRSKLSIYCDSDNVSLVILRAPEDTDKIVGRAVLWKLLDGKYFMDRVYSNTDSDVNLFKQYAKEQGWYVKVNNNSSSTRNVISPSGDIEFLKLSCQIGKNHGKFPYLDTLKWYSPKTGIISAEELDGLVYFLEDTDGGYEEECSRCDGSGLIMCDNCDGDGSLECGYCDGHKTSTCDNCDGDGEIDGKTCDDCGGDGKIDCVECRGDGTSNCEDCNGDGQYDCPECNEY